MPGPDASPNLPPDIPPEVVPFLEEAGYLDADRLTVGDSVPPLTAYTLGGQPVALASLWAQRPAVLVFGSYT